MELTSTKVLNIVKLNTNLDPRSVQLQGVGFDFWTYNIDDKWIFRFPKHQAAAEALHTEIELTRKLSISVPIPRIELYLARPIGFHLPIVGYLRLPGSSLKNFQYTKVNTSVLSEQIGKVLSEIHKTVLDFKETVFHQFVKPKTESQEFQLLKGTISDSELGFVMGAIKQSETLQLSDVKVLIQGDLSAENVLVSEDMQLTGILDWTNHQLGDRTYDFVGLWMWGGNKFVDEVLEHYEFELGSAEKSFIPAWGLITFIGRFTRELEEGREFKRHYLYQLFQDRIQELAGLV